jgi:hypothetical protein
MLHVDKCGSSVAVETITKVQRVPESSSCTNHVLTAMGSY